MVKYIAHKDELSTMLRLKAPDGIIHTGSQIYCDMDGVLANFILGANTNLKLFGKTLEQTEKEGTTWSYLNTIPGFFSSLRPLPDAFTLWAAIKKYDPFILSARPKTLPQGKNQKVGWLEKYFPDIPGQRIIICLKSEKALYAIDKSSGVANLLIDDDVSNINRWRKAGGIGILHTSAQDSIKQLKTMMV